MKYSQTIGQPQVHQTMITSPNKAPGKISFVVSPQKPQNQGMIQTAPIYSKLPPQPIPIPIQNKNIIHQ